MGGKSKSSTSQSSAVTDNRIAAGDSSIIATGNAQVDFLSDEALEEVLSYAGDEGDGSRDLVETVVTKAFESFVTTQNRAFDTTLASQGKAFEQTNSALEAQRSEGLQGFKQFLVAGVSVAALVAAAYVMKGKFK